MKATLFLTGHVIKSGLELVETRYDVDVNMARLQRYSPTYYIDLVNTVNGRLYTRTPSIFLQDDWTLNRRILIKAGLRWDPQWLLRSNRAIQQRITAPVSPRLGFVYQPGKLGDQKVFGHFGRYVQELSTMHGYYCFLPQKRDVVLYDHDPRVDPSGGTALILWSGGMPETPDLFGQHHDEIVLGYARRLGDYYTLRVQGIYRTLRQAIEDGVADSDGDGVHNPAVDTWYLGNPGRGPFEAYPRAKREYQGLEIGISSQGSGPFRFDASYVLSRTYGNYTGLFDKGSIPNITEQFDLPELTVNTEGFLPNDRRHALKFTGSYQISEELLMGALVVWHSGVPLSEMYFHHGYHYFLNQRGTAGRTPSQFDLNLRVTYRLKTLIPGASSRVFFDGFHLLGANTPLGKNQIHYLGLDSEGNPISPNSHYGSTIRYSPPLALRMGIQVDFGVSDMR